MLGFKRAQLLSEMEKFNSILESLPKEIAVKAGKYATYDKLPADLAKEVKWNHLNKTTFGLMEKVPQDLTDEMLKGDIYEGFSGELIAKIRDFLHPFDPSTVIINDGKDEQIEATPASTEVTEEAEEREDAMNEKEDTVREGEE
uniref:Spherical body protein 2 truncated copy 2 n=1 Tax=Babesia bovis TaxID=5865 RepID=S6BMQ6_BABBO|nr:spherical body protein 2 truncated copy 2 [Babesia bovis]